MTKLILPLLLIAMSGLAAEPPVVKSKAAQELLKHPEFKKAMEAAPEFTKAVMKELDKYAPAAVKKLNLDGVIRWDTRRAFGTPVGSGIKLPQFSALGFNKGKVRAMLLEFYDGWTMEKWKLVFEKPERFELSEDGKYFVMWPYSQHRILYNPVTEKTEGGVWWHVDKATLRVARLNVWFHVGDRVYGTYLPTADGKKLGYKDLKYK